MTLLCVFVLGGTAVFAQNDKCCQEGCVEKRTDKIARYLSLDEGQKAALLELNQQRMQSGRCKVDVKALSKAEKKEVKAADKAYAKSLKAIVGKKGIRQIKKMDQLEREAKALKEKQVAKAAKKAAKKKK